MLLLLSCMGVSDTGADPIPIDVPMTLAGLSIDGFTTFASTPEGSAELIRHKVTVRGKPADGLTIALHGWPRCEWEMSTPRAGQYIVTLHLRSGDERPGKFGYFIGEKEYVSEEFRAEGRYVPLLKSFRIMVPADQAVTRISLAGAGVYFYRVDLSPVTNNPLVGEDGGLRKLTLSSYRTVLRRPDQKDDEPPCVVLVPQTDPEKKLALRLADNLEVPWYNEPTLKEPFPAFPVPDLSPDTNLILVTGPRGGQLALAVRRAGLIEADHAVPGPGGYTIRVVPRPFRGKANLIVLAASDKRGLNAVLEAFHPYKDKETGELVYDRFLVEKPGEQWERLRSYRYRLEQDNPWWDKRYEALNQPFGGHKGGARARSYINTTAQLGDFYWRTGNLRFAKLFKDYIFKMEDEDIYGGPVPKDSHMALYNLMRAWDCVEEASVFSQEDRLRITNYLLLGCLSGKEGFPLAYTVATEYSGAVQMRHNHQTILGCGLMRAYLYYSRLYDLDYAQMWKVRCDELIANGTAWGHAPEDSPNYEPRTFIEVADMIHYQGLSTKGVPGTKMWPQAALRFLAVRDSLWLPSCYGDCWDNREYGSMRFIEIMGEDWDWPASQTAIDRLIRRYRSLGVYPDSTMDLYAYLHGSTDVGGLKTPPDPQIADEALLPLLGLAAIPMTEGYYSYLSGEVGNARIWKVHQRPGAPPYAKTADKIQYRSGFDTDDEYLLMDTIGWANHAHFDLGAIVQYCHGGRLWIVDAGYTNSDVRHHSTIEFVRDGKPTWGPLPREVGHTADFRSGPNMLEIVELVPNRSDAPGPFSVVCRTPVVAGATWTRKVSGGAEKGLFIEDTLTADEAGEYVVTFRLRLLGQVTGRGNQWIVSQEGAALPVILEVTDGDTVGLAKWEPDEHTWNEGRYPWYPFVEGDGQPMTIEWRRTVQLKTGQHTSFRARIGPSAAR
ncbi:hypothetical protein ACFL6S_23685 [Candidatus Poribacteria bacterium]